MLSVLWEIALPLLIAFAVGWLVMGWLTWRWRRAGVSEAEWVTVTAELKRAREQLAATDRPRPEPTVPAGPPATAPAADGAEPTAAPTPAPSPSAVATATPPPQVDDLKAIRGVGLKMEAKLHELGITSLRQVAAFTDEDIARVSAGIGAFPGRIEREEESRVGKEC
ncbi:MAG: hypothetical protein AAFO29_06195 [Actinomycetota bacterium]